MRQSNILLVLTTALVVGCSHKPEIGEIGSKTPGPWKPGTQITLTIPIHTTESVTYGWRSPDGGGFDDTSAPSPKFTLPQTPEARILCDLSIGGKPYPVNPFVAHVELADAGAAIHNEEGAAGPAGVPAPDNGNGPADIVTFGFVASGWMGDGAAGRKFIKPDLNSGDDLNLHRRAQKWTYRPGDAGWVAIAYQFPPDNWGSHRGKDWRSRKFQEITFYARGVETDGKLPLVEFKAGGGTDPAKQFQDSFAVQLPDPVLLTKEWRQYRISLAGKDLSNVTTGFMFAVSAGDNPKGATLYLADIVYR